MNTQTATPVSTATVNEIRKEVTKTDISVSRVYKGDYQKEGTMTAELKQTFNTTSFYPKKSVANSIQDNIFETADFGFEEESYSNSETRVAWIDVPAGTTAPQIAAKLQAMPNVVLYKILSSHPVIADTEQYAIDNEDLDVDLDTYADRQAVRYPKGSEQEGELALDVNGKVQYRRIALSKNGLEDQDNRTSDPTDTYLSESLEKEINEVSTAVESQIIGG